MDMHPELSPIRGIGIVNGKLRGQDDVRGDVEGGSHLPSEKSSFPIVTNRRL
jgi:hypothetical protein